MCGISLLVGCSRVFSYRGSLPLCGLPRSIQPKLILLDVKPTIITHSFFSSLYTVLKRGARAALQFYPENTDQVLLITECATRVGFQGGLVVDYPNSSKAKKYYLCLSFEHAYRVPKALGAGADGTSVGVTERERATKRRGKKGGRKGDRAPVKSRDWVLAKKEQQRRRGLEVRRDTKYTGRKRKEAL